MVKIEIKLIFKKYTLQNHKCVLICDNGIFSSSMNETGVRVTCT